MWIHPSLHHLKDGAVFVQCRLSSLVCCSAGENGPYSHISLIFFSLLFFWKLPPKTKTEVHEIRIYSNCASIPQVWKQESMQRNLKIQESTIKQLQMLPFAPTRITHKKAQIGRQLYISVCVLLVDTRDTSSSRATPYGEYIMGMTVFSS